MEVKMYTANATGTQNIVELINEDLKAQGEIIPKLTLHCIAFEANPGTAFKINNCNFVVPSTGKFVTPFEGDRYCKITNLEFPDGCTGLNIYYII